MRWGQLPPPPPLTPRISPNTHSLAQWGRSAPAAPAFIGAPSGRTYEGGAFWRCRRCCAKTRLRHPPPRRLRHPPRLKRLQSLPPPARLVLLVLLLLRLLLLLLLLRLLLLRLLLRRLLLRRRRLLVLLPLAVASLRS